MVTETNSINTSAISPADSSMWIATAARGLVRVGRNGKSFVYSSEKGDFASNNIVSLAFDNDGVLWIKDAENNVYSYTSFSGFVLQTTIPEDVAQQLSGQLFTEEQAVTPSPAPSSRPWFGSWWFLLLTLLLLGYCIYTFIKGRKRVEKPVTQPVTPVHPIPKPVVKPVSKPAVTKTVKSGAPADKTVVGVPESGSFYEKVYAISKENFTNPDFGVEDIATAMMMSRVHLNRKLKAENRPSPSDVIKSMRMDLAAEMLKAGGHSVSEIAAASGFSSASYFSSAFKEYFGVAPAAYGK
ncbi:MAG: helix-turn-helix domain-containing protein [Bacteroidales bacterium]|nr:helix-turn-helix domain-containing protein [Bacteroidales bacterium]